MIPPSHLNEQAALHSLDLLEGPERELFLRRLEKDPVLTALVDEYRETLSQAIAASVPPQSPGNDLFAGILKRVETPEMALPPLKVAPLGKSGRPEEARSSWVPLGTWIWPAAALFMLGVNFYLVWLVVEAREQVQVFVNQAAAETGMSGIRPDPLDRQLPDHPEQRMQSQEALAGEQGYLEAFTAEGVGAEEQVVWLEAQNQELIAERDRAERAYSELVRRAGPLLDGAAGYARYTVMELVRDDLWASMTVDRIIQFSREGADLPGLPPPFGNGASLAVNLPEGEPYAISQFDELSGRGEMYLVNSPEIAEGRHLHLWMRDALGDGGYISIGPIPPGYPGQELSITFEVVGEPITPVEMIVTDEPLNNPAQPAGPIVLRGPSAVTP